LRIEEMSKEKSQENKSFTVKQRKKNEQGQLT